jgi:hypothetical protein
MQNGAPVYAECFLEHYDNAVGLIPEIARHSLHRSAAGEFTKRDDKMQLAPPLPEGQPGFLNH